MNRKSDHQLPEAPARFSLATCGVRYNERASVAILEAVSGCELGDEIGPERLAKQIDVMAGLQTESAAAADLLIGRIDKAFGGQAAVRQLSLEARVAS